MNDRDRNPLHFLLLFFGGICVANFVTLAGLFYYQTIGLHERREISREVQIETLRHLRNLDPDGGAQVDLGALVGGEHDLHVPAVK
jgi:hypothetical protein